VKGPPNILWITLDSLKATALPVYGNPHCLAPNAVRMAERGIVVEHAYCQMPKCVPSRPSMLASRYPHVDGLRALQGKADSHSPGTHFTLDRGVPNLVTELRHTGYTTCTKGPNHLVNWDVYTEWFDCTTDWEGHKLCQRPRANCDDALLLRAQYAGVVPDDFDIERDPDAETARQVCAFLAGHDRDKPFFAYMDVRAPHPPYRLWPVFKEHYDALDVPLPPRVPVEEAPWTERVYRQVYGLEDMTDENWQAIIKAYYSAVSYNDMLVGRVLDALAARGLDDNTIVIYSADHGDYAGEHGCVEKHDPLLYDCHVRLPFIMQLPPGFPRGERLDIMMEMIDITPTLLDLCGLEIPRSMQGRSIAPFINGARGVHRDAVFSQGGVEREAIDRRDLLGDAYFEQSAQFGAAGKHEVINRYPDFVMRAKMIRTRTHKHVYRLNGHHELYDLCADPCELHNLHGQADCADTECALQEQMLRWMIASETNLPLIDQVWA
jgi:choline-sulfatase